MQVFHIDDHGDNYWFVANSVNDALRMHVEPMLGYYPDDLATIDESKLNSPLSSVNVIQIPENQYIAVRDEETDLLETKRASEWAASGPGLLASDVV